MTNTEPVTLWETLLARYEDRIELDAEGALDHRTSLGLGEGMEQAQFRLNSPISQEDFNQTICEYFEQRGFTTSVHDCSVAARKEGPRGWVAGYTCAPDNRGDLSEFMILSVIPI